MILAVYRWTLTSVFLLVVFLAALDTIQAYT